MKPPHLAQHLLGLEGGEAADFRGAGAGRIGGVQHVDVEAHIGGSVADDPAGFRHDGLVALLHHLFDAHHADAHLLAPLEVVEVIHRAAQPDLDRALGVQHAFLDGAPEGRAVGVFEAAEIAVIKIGVGIEVDHADGLLLAHRAQHRQRAEMITTC